MRTQLSCALAALLLTAAPPAFAMSDADCTKAFETADANKDGWLSEAEAGRYYAAMRVSNKPVADGKLTREVFLTNCKADLFAEARMEQGAPLEGANSFTENQAKDRVAARGFTDVSALTKDDKGIWRGTASEGGNKVNVAVDYKGNVVAN